MLGISDLNSNPQHALSKQEIYQYMKPEDFIQQYKTALRSQDWKNVEPLIHNNAAVTFSNGIVNEGKAAIKTAFERNFSLIKNEKYSVQNIRWLLKNESTAVYLFEFFWKGIINEQSMEGSGIGTSVLIMENEKWFLLSEHLGKKS